MVTGLVVGCFAIGSFVFNFISTAIVNPQNKKPSVEKEFNGHTEKFFEKEISENIPKMFWILGSIFFVVISTGLFMIKDVNWREEHHTGANKDFTQEAHSPNSEYVHEFNLNKEELVQVKMRPRMVSPKKGAKGPDGEKDEIKVDNQLEEGEGIPEEDEFEDRPEEEVNGEDEENLNNVPDRLESGKIEESKNETNDSKEELSPDLNKEISSDSRNSSMHILPDLNMHQSEKVFRHSESENDMLSNTSKRNSLRYVPEMVQIVPTENQRNNSDNEEESEEEQELQLDILYHQPENEITFRHALKTRNFYIIFFTTMLAGTAGMFSLANFKVVGLEYGYDDSFLTIVGSLGSVMNGTNRPFWGMLFDKNYKLVYRCVCLLAIVLCFTFPYVAGIKPLFAIWIIVLYSCSGATITQLAPISIKLYGKEVGFRVYATLFLANGCAGMTVYITQDYIAYYIGGDAVYFIIGGLACVAFIIVSFFKPKIENKT